MKRALWIIVPVLIVAAGVAAWWWWPKAETNYQVSELCAKVDFAPVNQVLGAEAGEAVSDREEKADFTAYTCDRRFTNGTANVSALIFQSGASADKHYADLAENATPTQHWFHDGNLVLGVRLTPSVARSNAAVARTAATDLANSVTLRLKQ